MQEKIKGLATKMTDKWRSLEKGQKIRLSAIVAMLFVVTGIAIFMATRPQMVVLRSGLDWPATAQIQEVLANNGIRSTPNAAGTAISVNSRDTITAEAILAQENITVGRDLFSFREMMSSNSFSTSDRLTRESLKRAGETDIVEALRTINGIEDAQVNIVLADDTVYWLENYENASASIVLTVSGTFNRNQGETVARVVVGAVRGLDLKNVEIVDQNSNVIFSGSEATNNSLVTKEMELRASKENEISGQIRSLIGPLYDEIQVMSSLRFDMDTLSQRTHEFAPHDPAATEGLPSVRTSDSASVENSTAGAEAGLMANDNAVDGFQMGDGLATSANSRSNSESFLYNEIVTSIERSAGQFLPNDSSVAVVAYRFDLIYEDYVRKNGLLGDLTWEEFKRENGNSVELEISDAVLASLRTGTGINNLDFIAFQQPIFFDSVPAQVQVEQVIILAILAVLIFLLAYGLIKNSQPDEIIEIEPELSVEDLLVTTQLEESQDLSELERMRSLQLKESETKRQIEKFVDEKPEAVAQLLRNWLNEEWE